MRQRRKKYEIYFVIVLAVFTIFYFSYSQTTSENKGLNYYADAMELYKQEKYTEAYKIFQKVPAGSTLKDAALFRQARCHTITNNKPGAIKKYNRIIHSGSKSSIVPISEYNMAVLLFENNDSRAAGHFKNILKKYPMSDYATASQYYLGLITLEKLKTAGEKHAQTIKTTAADYFKSYLEKSPDGRFSLNSVNKIEKLGLKLNNYDNLLIAQSYYLNGEYENAKQYLNKTTLSQSWTDFVKNEYKLGNYDKVRYYTEKGLKEFPDSVALNDIYDSIDNYIASFSTRKEGINSLVSKKITTAGGDYIAYLNCNEVVSQNSKEACYKNLYEKYPDGKFSADSLYNLFISKYLQKKYYDAQRLGFLHMKKFPNVKSSPAISYYMGKIAYKLKHYEKANFYYQETINKYPDSYYAYRAGVNLNKEDGAFPFLDLTYKTVAFPYKKSIENNFVIKLALLKDYDLVEELCKNDKFIQSWIMYEKGNYTLSAIMARNAMEELIEKPPFDDLRWRLIYPLHYYNWVEKVKGSNNPLIIQSIIKEESHFNPYATSYVGAKGLMQLMPSTYNEITKRVKIPADIYNADNNIQVGSIYYESLKKVLGSKDLYAISAYNGGIGSVTNWFSKITYTDTDEFVEQIPYPETKNYVKKVLRTYWMYGNIYK